MGSEYDTERKQSGVEHSAWYTASLRLKLDRSIQKYQIPSINRTAWHKTDAEGERRDKGQKERERVCLSGVIIAVARLARQRVSDTENIDIGGEGIGL